MSDNPTCTARALPTDLDLEHAHRMMQVHRSCPRSCPTRQAALEMLVATGHYRLSSRFG
ncbi:hypothetical protein [Nocardia iowensis]|uniref:Uncharacterized protein n=1 Tax=Nocardia iowensis TaxID=204891 RepID=A0ABX8RQA1_NOCIO|nr:hypothetical protein [Nocardia iowensis]QXN91808.1 hypothetical protein KV110_00960 [Nocardia iowensis]